MINILYHESNRMLGVGSTICIVILMVLLECAAVLCYRGILSFDDVDLVGLAVITAIVLGVCALAILLRLDVTVTDDEIRIRTIGTRTIARDDIGSATVRTDLKAVREYGGYGIRIWLKGTGYTVPGLKTGVEISVLGKNRRVFISSKDAESLASALS